MTLTIHPVILCGGSGTRLWPLSTPETPKQFLALTSGEAMISETAKRFAASSSAALDFGQVTVVGSMKHRELLQQTLPDARLVLEPFGRNSAPAIAAACILADPDDLLLILPADHNIVDIPAFHAAIATGVVAARDGSILTFGIQPENPATGYGYIRSSGGETAVQDVLAFVEKPELELAEKYLADGNYFWNAGIFLFRASVMLEALDAFAPGIAPPVNAALHDESSNIFSLNPDHFINAPDTSIDYAVMEHAPNVKVVPVNMGWSDVGDYQALHDLLSTDDDTTVTIGPVLAESTTNIYANSQGPLIALSGVHNLTIVATSDTVMVTKSNDSAAVKSLGKQVQSSRARLSVDADLVEEATQWLWATFDVWADKAWDQDAGGFVEQVSFEGEPDVSSPRRIRVQARQTFSFARAMQYGWHNQSLAQLMVDRGLDYIDQKLRHPDGGWVHIVDQSAEPIDSKRDLYDHAFIILAGAAAYEATGKPLGLALATESLQFVNSTLKAEKLQGWLEGLPPELPRRANPHMHLLEASCALYRATKDKAALEIAHECVFLFERKFFDPSTNIMSEFFDQTWGPIANPQEAVFETGHMYEWATLLSEYDRLTGHDSLSWRRRMIRTSDRLVQSSGHGFALNAQRLDGQTVNARRRLWPQLEMLRAHLLHPGLAPHGTPERLYRAIRKEYLDAAPEGLWIDEIDEQGAAYSKTVPASILYHFITALSPLLE